MSGLAAVSATGSSMAGIHEQTAVEELLHRVSQGVLGALFSLNTVGYEKKWLHL